MMKHSKTNPDLEAHLIYDKELKALINFDPRQICVSTA